jgi:hypothetical protein
MHERLGTLYKIKQEETLQLQKEKAQMAIELEESRRSMELLKVQRHESTER